MARNSRNCNFINPKGRIPRACPWYSASTDKPMLDAITDTEILLT